MGHSACNADLEVRAALNFPPETCIVDSTLRSLQAGFSGSGYTVRDLMKAIGHRWPHRSLRS